MHPYKNFMYLISLYLFQNRYYTRRDKIKQNYIFGKITLFLKSKHCKINSLSNDTDDVSNSSCGNTNQKLIIENTWCVLLILTWLFQKKRTNIIKSIEFYYNNIILFLFSQKHLNISYLHIDII